MLRHFRALVLRTQARGNDGAFPSKEQISLLAHRIDQCAVLLFSDMALHRDQCNVRAGRERELDHTMQGALF